MAYWSPFPTDPRFMQVHQGPTFNVSLSGRPIPVGTQPIATQHVVVSGGYASAYLPAYVPAPRQPRFLGHDAWGRPVYG